MDDDVTDTPPLEGRDRVLVDGVRARQPRALAKMVTLVESTRGHDRDRASAMLDALRPHAGGSIRVGVTGSPGVGKSTFIEALGLHLIARGLRVAVLAIDPSSTISGGSILADKTRMERLAQAPGAFIRPSPSGGALGGVADKTREALLVCEAAGFDVVIVETVGVGQSETTVAGMVDVFVLLQLPNAGDDLQAIKKGIVELADLIVVNKADLDPAAADRARHQFTSALALLRPRSPHWRPPVLTVSSTSGAGIDAFWAEIEHHRATMTATGEQTARRCRQAVDSLWSQIDAGLRARFRAHPQVRDDLQSVVLAVGAGAISPVAASRRLLDHLDGGLSGRGGTKNEKEN